MLFCVCSVCVAGIMAGSPCPPELLKKLISAMGIKGIVVSKLRKYNFTIIILKFLEELFLSHLNTCDEKSTLIYKMIQHSNTRGRQASVRFNIRHPVKKEKSMNLRQETVSCVKSLLDENTCTSKSPGNVKILNIHKRYVQLGNCMH